MTKAERRATKTDKLIANARGEQQIRGLNRHRIIPRVIQPPSGGANAPPSGQGSGSTGNFLEPQGDTMVGAIAFFPKVAAIDGTDPDNPSIDIGNAGEDYSTYVLSGGTDPLDKIGTILNASFAGQLLYLQSTALPSLELINGNATNLGNILTGTGDSIFLDFGQIATLIFDVSAGTGGVGIQGAWRVIAGGTGTPGGATQLNDLTDVTLTNPLLDQVLTFDGSVWVNQAPQSGGMDTNLSNMISPTVPVVPLDMNGQNVLGINNLDFSLGGVKTITTLDNLFFSDTSQSIRSNTNGLNIQVGSVQEIIFETSNGIFAKFDEVNATDRRFDMQSNEIVDIARLRFSPVDSIDVSFISQIYEESGFNNLRYVTKNAHVFVKDGTSSTLLTIGEIIGGGGFLQDIGLMNFNALEINSIIRDGDFELVFQSGSSGPADMFVQSGGVIRNMSDIGAGGAGNEISQGDSSVTVTDSGTGIVNIKVDAFNRLDITASTITNRVPTIFSSLPLSELGDTTPSPSGVRNLGDATRVWNSVFTNEVLLQNSSNKISGDSGGINYDVGAADAHDYSIAGALRLRVSNTVINIFSVGLDLGGGDISNVDDMIFQGSGSVINMAGGDITSVDDITMSGSGSILNMSGGDISGVDNLNVVDGIFSDDVSIAGDIRHTGPRIGFFGQSAQVRKQALLPTGTSNNELFIALFNIIQALGNLSGFGYGIVDSGQ